MVGGSEEAYHAGVSEYEELILSKRKGFIRIALETGTPIVPVYGFGENALYTIIPSKHPYWQKFQSFFKSLTKYPISVVNGRGIGNFEFGILPRRVPLTTVLGEPIIVPKIEKPSQEEIDKWHSLYIEKLKDVYRDYKGSTDDLIIL
jgi:2-acylglycerol O-acyltransferase 2